MFGPPKYGEERIVLSFFFSLPGARIVCGGTTANTVSSYLQKPIDIELTYIRPDVPPIGKLDGVDLVTEGIITLKRVEEMLKTGEKPGKDGASMILSMIRGAEEIHFICGVLTAEKKELVSSLISLLKEKNVRVIDTTDASFLLNI